MAQDLSGKVALVTGASSGIGEASALALAKAGVRVALAGRRKARLEALVERIAAFGGQALALPGDVSVEADAIQAVAATINQFGKIDILINSAGIIDSGGIETTSTEQWRRVLDTNLMGTIYCCRAAFRLMKQQGAGDIINISSIAGRRAGWAFAAYATSKYGITGFTEALRQEGGSQGIRVCTIEPGETATEISTSIADPKWRDVIRQTTHNENSMASSDIADAIMLVVQLPRRANVSRILIHPTTDTSPMP